MDKMTEDTLEMMARAVEKSSIVLMAMSRKYQSRPDCRLGSFNSITDLKPRRRQRQLQRHSTNQLINSRFSRDVTATMLVYRTMAIKVFWEFHSIIMQNLSDILPVFCTPKWPSHHVSENQEYHFRRKHLCIHLKTT